jgi:hypothetical protein
MPGNIVIFFLFFCCLSIFSYADSAVGLVEEKNSGRETSVDLDPDQLQFMLDLGGSSHNPELGQLFEQATHVAIDQKLGYQRVVFIGAAIEVLSRTAALAANTPAVSGGSEEMRHESLSAGRMLYTARKVIESLSDEEVDKIIDQFESFHLKYLEEHNPNPDFNPDSNRSKLTAIAAGMFLGGLLPIEALLVDSATAFSAGYFSPSIDRAAALEREKYYFNQLSIASEQDNFQFYQQEKEKFIRLMISDPEHFLETDDLLDCDSNYKCRSFCRKHYEAGGNGGFLGVVPELCAWVAYKMGLEMVGSGSDEVVPEDWKNNWLPKLKESLLELSDWFAFTRENSIFETIDENGESSLSYSSKAVSTITDKALISPGFKKLAKWKKYEGWVKFGLESKFATRAVQVIIQVSDLGKSIADGAVYTLEQYLNLKKMTVTVKPEMLTHHFAKSFEAFAEHKGIGSLTHYSGSASEKSAMKDLDRSGFSGLSTMTMIRKAIARSVAIEASVDILFKSGRAFYTGREYDNVDMAGRNYTVTGRDAIQQTGIQRVDEWRNRSFAVEDEYEKWKANMVSNVTGYVAGGAAVVVATPVIFGAAAAAGLPSGGVGGVVVAVAGYGAVGVASAAASEGARALVDGVDDRVNIRTIESRLKGIWLDMEKHQKSEDEAAKAVAPVASAAKVRYENGHPLRFMALVDDFSNVEIFDEENTYRQTTGRMTSRGLRNRSIIEHNYSLAKFRLHQKNGNFLGSDRASSWVNFWTRATPLNEFLLGGDNTSEEEARLIFDFYDLSYNQGQWDPYTDRIINVGKMGQKGCIIAGMAGDNIILKNGMLDGQHEDNSIRVLSNGIVMSKDEEEPERWVIRGSCDKYDLYIRREAGTAAGRYTCFKGQYKFMRVLNNEQSVPVSAVTSTTVSVPTTYTGVPNAEPAANNGETDNQGALDNWASEHLGF